jgi:hypothetical protein
MVLNDIKLANRASENVAQFKYLGTTVTNENLIQAGIKSKLDSGNARYLKNYNVQNYNFAYGSV